jgi:hypothetical protein
MDIADVSWLSLVVILATVHQQVWHSAPRRRSR